MGGRQSSRLLWLATLAVLGISAGGCAVSGTASGTRPESTPDGMSEIRKTLTPTLLARTPTIPAGSDLYYRLQLVTPEHAGTLALASERRGTSVLRHYFLGNQRSSTLVTLSTQLGSTSLPQQVLYAESREAGSITHASYGAPFLSPYFQAGLPLVLRFAVKHSRQSESRLASTLSDTLSQFAAPVSGLSLLSRLTGAQWQDAQTRVDKAVAEAFSEQQSPEVSLAITPEQTESIDLLLREDGSGPHVLARVQVSTTRSLLAAEGDLQRFPADPIQLLATPVNGDKQTLTQAIQQDKQLWPLFEKEAYAEFCRGAAEKLAVLGLNRVDTAAVLYAWLVDSRWNRERRLRGGNAGMTADRCSSLTEILQATNLAGRLKSVENLQQEDRRRRQWLARLRQGFFQRVSQVWQGHLRSDWENLLADKVSLSVSGGGFALTDTLTLSPEQPRIYFNDDAALLLARATHLVAIPPGDTPCFQILEDNSNSRFWTGCLRSKLPDSPLQRVELTLDRPLDGSAATAQPQISAIRFIVEPATAPEPATPAGR